MGKKQAMMCNYCNNVYSSLKKKLSRPKKVSKSEKRGKKSKIKDCMYLMLSSNLLFLHELFHHVFCELVKPFLSRKNGRWWSWSTWK